jgi:hypothetical protein
MTGGLGDVIDDLGIRLARTIRASMTGSWLAQHDARIAAPAGGSSSLGDGFGFSCVCGCTGGPWPSQGEAECLAGIHDHLQHGSHPNQRVAQIVPASALPARTGGALSPSGVQITAQSGLSVGGGQR